MKKSLLLLLLFLPLFVSAKNEEEKKIKLAHRDSIYKVETARPHEIHVGIADIMYESMMFHNEAHLKLNIPTMANEVVTDEKTNYRHLHHLFVDYHYRFTQWFSIGLLADIDAVFWDIKHYSGMNKLVYTTKNENFWNLVLIPQARFTWLNRKWVHMYSSIGVGLNVNGGSEVNLAGQHTVCAPAVDIRAIGLQVGKGRWFGCVELGGTHSLIDQNEVYLLQARTITIGAGVRL